MPAAATVPAHAPRRRLGAVVSHVSLASEAEEVKPSATPRPFCVADAQSMKSAGELCVSPTGSHVAWTQTQKDLEADSSETSLWMAPTSGGAPIRMSAPGTSASSPAWSPDGSLLCFVSARDIPAVLNPPGEEVLSTSQVWAFNMSGGDAQPITRVKQGVSGFVWSPDAARPRLLLTVRDPDPDADLEEKERNKPKPWVMERQQFKVDYTGYLHNRRGNVHLYVHEGGLDGQGGGKLTQITSGNYDESGGVWCPGGQRVAFASNRTSDPDANSTSNIWVVSADNSDMGQTLVQVTDDVDYNNSSPGWSPDGKMIVYNTCPSWAEVMWYSTNHLAVAAADGSDATTGGRVLTVGLDRNLFSAQFSESGAEIYCTLEDHGMTHLAAVQLEGSKKGEDCVVLRLIDGEVSVVQFAVSTSGGVVVALVSTASHPSEVFLVEKGGELQQLSHLNDELLAHVTLATVKKVSYPCDDVRTYTTIGNRKTVIDTTNHEVETFVFYPPGFDASSGFKYPTLLWIHGALHVFDRPIAASAPLLLFLVSDLYAPDSLSCIDIQEGQWRSTIGRFPRLRSSSLHVGM